MREACTTKGIAGLNQLNINEKGSEPKNVLRKKPIKKNFTRDRVEPNVKMLSWPTESSRHQRWASAWWDASRLCLLRHIWQKHLKKKRKWHWKEKVFKINKTDVQGGKAGHREQRPGRCGQVVVGRWPKKSFFSVQQRPAIHCWQSLVELYYSCSVVHTFCVQISWNWFWALCCYEIVLLYMPACPCMLYMPTCPVYYFFSIKVVYYEFMHHSV